MIGIVCLNLCTDKTFFLDDWERGGVQKPADVFVQAGGKGINVARVLNHFGQKTKIFCMTAGEQGAYIENLLRRDNFDYSAVHVGGQSRMYLTLFSGKNESQIAVKEKGPDITEQEAEEIRRKFIRYLDENQFEYLSVSDTIACENLKSFYAFAVREAEKRHITVLLDADLEALTLALAAKPSMIKPNLEEYGEITGQKPENISLPDALRDLQNRGIPYPLISLGQDGAVFAENGKWYHATCDETGCVNPVGCGDSFIAGLLFGRAGGENFQNSVRIAVASGCANALQKEAANIDYEDMKRMLPRVHIKEMGSL